MIVFLFDPEVIKGAFEVLGWHLRLFEIVFDVFPYMDQPLAPSAYAIISEIWVFPCFFKVIPDRRKYFTAMGAYLISWS